MPGVCLPDNTDCDHIHIIMGIQFNDIQVVVPAYAGTTESVNDTLEQLFLNSLLNLDILVLVSDENRTEVEAAASRLGFCSMRIERVDDAFRARYPLVPPHVFYRGGFDRILIQPDTVLVRGWDRKLQDAAYRDASAVTVSAMTGGSSIFGLEVDTVSRALPDVDTVAVNVFIEQNFRSRLINVPFFSPVCSYFKAYLLNTLDFGAGEGIASILDSCSNRGFIHCLTTDLYVQSGIYWEYAQMVTEKYALMASSLEARHPILHERHFLKTGMLNHTVTSSSISRPTLLHVIHNWGGGLEKWVRDYTEASRLWNNLILKSIGNWGAFGSKLALFEDCDAERPIEFWEFSKPFHATAVHHSEYESALNEIVRKYKIDLIIVSSFIGHSLDVLNTSLATWIVCHDFFPFCSALNIYFNGICTNCDKTNLQECQGKNLRNRYFNGVAPEEWLAVREMFVCRVIRNRIPMICPTESIVRHYKELDQRFNSANFTVIPHGLPDKALTRVKSAGGCGRLKAVVLGRLTEEKGLTFFDSVVDDLLEYVDIYLVGCGDAGRKYSRKQHVSVIDEYRPDELDKILQKISPDMGLLFSSCPETFSYTLHELMEAAIPPLATNIGSFADKIRHGENGFLFEIDREKIIGLVSQINEKRDMLETVRDDLIHLEKRTAGDMVRDYQAMFGRVVYTRASLSVSAETETGRLYSSGSPHLIMGNDIFSMFRSFKINIHEKIDSSPRSCVIKKITKGLFRLWTLFPDVCVRFWEIYLKYFK